MAIANWLKTTGAGPFFIFDELHFTDSNYRGTPMDIAPCRAAFGQHGDTQIELVCATDDSPGIWNDVVPRGSSACITPGSTATITKRSARGSDPVRRLG